MYKYKIIYQDGTSGLLSSTIDCPFKAYLDHCICAQVVPKRIKIIHHEFNFQLN